MAYKHNFPTSPPIPKKHVIRFSSGTSRHGNYHVNYLISDDIDDPLYAECRIPKNADVSDEYGYFSLKINIIAQALARGIPLSSLEFWYDDEESFFCHEAFIDVKVSGW